MRKETVVDRVEILPETGFIQVRQRTHLVEDDGTRTPIGLPHRRAFLPGHPAITGESGLVQRVAAAVWTTEVLRAHEARVESRRTQLDGREGAPQT